MAVLYWQLNQTLPSLTLPNKFSRLGPLKMTCPGKKVSLFRFMLNTFFPFASHLKTAKQYKSIKKTLFFAFDCYLNVGR